MDLTGRDSLDRYLKRGINDVVGWLSFTSADFIAHLARFQTSNGITGDTCEIGIHHGKLFLILANVTTGDERAVAVDVFGDQHKNTDYSGYGDRAIFEGHLRTFAPDAAVDIVQESSLDLPGTDFAKRKFRMFSVDGGHTAEITQNDLVLAQTCTLPGGIVVLDDILNSHWLGVVEGTARYFMASGALVPFAISPNKLFLTTTNDFAQKYAGELKLAFPDAITKEAVAFFGSNLIVFEERPCHRDASPRELDLMQELVKKQQEMDKMLNSKSWKITAPLRWVRSRLS